MPEGFCGGETAVCRAHFVLLIVGGVALGVAFGYGASVLIGLYLDGALGVAASFLPLGDRTLSAKASASRAS
jgi:hypothetical protein